MATDDLWRLPVSFYFDVEFQEGPVSEKIPFQAVSGLEMELDTEPWQEGGANDWVHQLPKGAKGGRLSLRRALLPLQGGAGAQLAAWAKEVINGDRSKPIKTSAVLVHLLDENGQTLHLWRCANAYPVKWAAEALDAQKNEIAIAELSLACSSIVQEK